MDHDLLQANICETIGSMGGAHTVKSLWVEFGAELRKETSKAEIQQALIELAEAGVLRQERSLKGGWEWSWPEKACASDCALLASAREDARLLSDLREALSELDCGDSACMFARELTGQRTNGGCSCLETLFGYGKKGRRVRVLLRKIGGRKP